MQETVTLADWISVLINLLLLIVTLSTVIYASKTLLMEHSSQVIVSRIKERFSIKEEYPYSWEVEIKNVGNGYIVKAFILLSMQSKDKKWDRQYFLSKPVVGINPERTYILKLFLKDKYMDKTNRNPEVEKIEVLYQDSLNNIYRVEPGLLSRKGFNAHLEQFDKLPKRLNKYSFIYWNYKRKMKKSVNQGNSTPQILKIEMREMKLKYEEKFKDIKFEPINPKDTE